MKEFLNRFMAWNRHLTKIPSETLRSLFVNAITVVYDSIGKSAFRPTRAINTAVFDAVMVGITRRLISGNPHTLEGVKESYYSLVSNEEFLEVTQHSTGHPTNVERRLKMATEAFAAA